MGVVVVEKNIHCVKCYCVGHGDWVLALAWAPSGTKVASGSKNGKVLIWDPTTGKQMGKPLTGHKDYITFLAWEPLHL
jgi:ribosome assembly protein 4